MAGTEIPGDGGGWGGGGQWGEGLYPTLHRHYHNGFALTGSTRSITIRHQCYCGGKKSN